MAEIGYFSLCLALIAAAYAAVASVAGVRRQHAGLQRSSHQALLALFGLLTVAVGALWYALLTHDFQLEYVAENTSRALPTLYVVAALWGGQSGSLLFWGWLLAGFGAAVVLFSRSRYRDLLPYAIPVLAAGSFFFCLVHLFAADPFVRLPFTPEDGRGLNPLLQHPAMAIHPPLLYLGMVGMSVPFAFALAALWSGRLDDMWVRAARRWMLLPWIFLGAGLLLGGKWAYVELGWGGYWGWDPVENASLMPWLASTAFLHSIMIQERRAMLKVWNVVLAILTHGLCIFGTFMTRSGLVSSVHAFAQSNIGPFFATFLVLTLVVSFALLWWRLPALQPERRLESLLSRETAFLLNNWILLGMLFAVLWGTLFPVLSETFTGEQITVGSPFFNRVTIPLGLVLLVLTGAGPLFAWRRTSRDSLRRNFTGPLAGTAVAVVALALAGVRSPYALASLGLCAFVVWTVALEFVRGVTARQRTSQESKIVALGRLLTKNRRRYGGYVVHLGMILLFVGFTGKAFTVEEEFVLGSGEWAEFENYRVRYETLAHSEDANKTVTAAAVSLFDADGFLATLLPARHAYHSFDQGTTEVAIHARWYEDIYLILVGWEGDGSSAKFQVYVNPLVNGVWLGGVVLALGGFWCLWPTVRERRLASLDRRVSTR